MLESGFRQYVIAPAIRHVWPDDNSLENQLREIFPWVVPQSIFLGSLFGLGPWLQQGWKLHISATAANALEVIQQVAPVLRNFGVRFKVVSSIPHLMDINGGVHGITQIGKFITIYPSDDIEAVRLGQALDAATDGMAGPHVPSDRVLRPGSLVYYRYGSFRQFSTDDAVATMLFDSVGRLAPDHRLPYYIHPLGITHDPFITAGISPRNDNNAKPFLDRFLVLRALHRSIWGRIYDTIDLNATPPRRCIVKEFWHDVAMDSYGRDSSHHAALEGAILANHEDCTVLPRLLDLIYSNGNTYLVLEYIEGKTLAETYQIGSRSQPVLDEDTLMTLGRGIARAALMLHQRGIIHRDLKPSNVLLDQREQIRLVDLAFSYRLGIDKGPPIGLGTIGFIPENETEQLTPNYLTDVYGWGAIMHLLATRDQPVTVNELGATIQVPKRSMYNARPDLPKTFCELVDSAVHVDPQQRPAQMEEILELLNQSTLLRSTRMVMNPSKISTNLLPTTTDWKQLAIKTSMALCNMGERRGTGIAWRAAIEGSITNGYLPNIYSGSTGIALFLANVAKEVHDESFAEPAEAVVYWLSDSVWNYGSTNCGLYSGEAGIGLFYLKLAKLLNKPSYIDMAVLRARRLIGVQPSTFDLVDGSAGLLLFLTELQSLTGEHTLRERAIELGDELIGSAIRIEDSSIRLYWEVPSIIPGLPAQSYLGLLHGAAGIGLSLLTLGVSIHEQRFIDAAIQVGEHLLAKMKVDQVDQTFVHLWPRTLDDDASNFSAHCHGAGGIGQFLIRLWCYCGDERFLSAARGAAAIIASRDPMHSSQCHGLAGDGSLFLDLFQATSEDTFINMAYVAGYQLGLYRKEDLEGVWTRSIGGDVSPDYMTGCAGVGAFCLRLSSPTSNSDLLLPPISLFTAPN